MKTIICSLLCLAMIVALGPSAHGAAPRKKKKTGYTPPAAPTPSPAPSVDLSRFIGVNLDKILGPLEQKVELPRAELAQLRTSLAARFSKASLAERAQFQAALAVCDALSQAMDERNRATANPAAANWPQRSLQLRQNIDQLVARQRAAESATSTPPGR